MGLKKTKVGKVVSVSGEKTLTVVVETRRPHPVRLLRAQLSQPCWQQHRVLQDLSAKTAR